MHSARVQLVCMTELPLSEASLESFCALFRPPYGSFVDARTTSALLLTNSLPALPTLLSLH